MCVCCCTFFCLLGSQREVGRFGLLCAVFFFPVVFCTQKAPSPNSGQHHTPASRSRPGSNPFLGGSCCSRRRTDGPHSNPSTPSRICYCIESTYVDTSRLVGVLLPSSCSRFDMSEALCSLQENCPWRQRRSSRDSRTKRSEPTHDAKYYYASSTAWPQPFSAIHMPKKQWGIHSQSSSERHSY